MNLKVAGIFLEFSFTHPQTSELKFKDVDLFSGFFF